MSEMGISQAVFLGLIQGATEFLPVSSSGHLVLAEYFMDVTGGGLAFDVFLHMGTLLAVIIYFFRQWWRLFCSIFSPGWKNPDFRLLVALVLATIPGGLAGLLLEGWVANTLRSPWVVVFTLTGVAVILFLADRNLKGERTIEGLGLKGAILIGVAQALAVVPGVSRSGITMSMGLLIGLNREDSARFSFLLSCPIILGAGVFESIKIFGSSSGPLVSGPMVAGFLASFVSGILVISFLLNFLQKHTFLPFVIYRVALAAIVVFFLLTPGHGNSMATSSLIPRLGKGVVNITSKPLEESYALMPYGDEGLATGIIIDNQGHVVTDATALVDKRSLEVTLWNGARWPAKFLGIDPPSRVAVLTIEAPQGVLSSLMPFQLSTDVRVGPGDHVFLIGNPLGLGTSVMAGTIFSAPRSIATPSGAVLDRVIVFDRCVPKSLAGSALVKRSTGMGIGMVTMVFSRPRGQGAGGRACLGFAIPVSYVLRVSQAIISKGHVDHVWLGATCKTLGPQLAQVLGLEVERGVLVLEVHKGSPAWKAGLKGGDHVVQLGNQRIQVGGDVIVAVNGRAVFDLPMLVDVLEEIGPGEKAVFKVVRKGRERNIALYLGKKRY